MTIRVAITGFGRIGRNVLRAHYENGKKHEKGANDDGDKQVILWLGADFFIIPNQLDIKAKLFVRSGDHSNMGGDASGLYVGAEFFF